VLTIRTILHATDFSESADCAFRLACALARAHGARLLVLHVGRRPVIIPAERADPRGPSGSWKGSPPGCGSSRGGTRRWRSSPC
jgi:nucleotide-binding universal stress UspA family protein